jgi:transcriptional regulator with XRE-family HTH domain
VAADADRATVVQLRRAAFGSRLRQLRTARGLSQDGLAGLAGVDRSHYSQIEMGKHSPSVDWVYDVAAALEVHVSELFKESA